jgi:hypothetical protein
MKGLTMPFFVRLMLPVAAPQTALLVKPRSHLDHFPAREYRIPRTQRMKNPPYARAVLARVERLAEDQEGFERRA